jgi:hypothetical protein
MNQSGEDPLLFIRRLEEETNVQPLQETWRELGVFRFYQPQVWINVA